MRKEDIDSYSYKGASKSLEKKRFPFYIIINLFLILSIIALFFINIPEFSIFNSFYDDFTPKNDIEKKIYLEYFQKPSLTLKGDDRVNIYKYKTMDGKSHTIRINLSSTLYSYYASKRASTFDSTLKYIIDLKKEEFAQNKLKFFLSNYNSIYMPEWYFRLLLESPYDDIYYKKIISEIRKNNPGISDDELVEHLTLLVQTMKYDYLDTTPTVSPYETLFTKKGVCGDSSLLLASLLSELEYDVVLFLFEDAQHAALGIRCPFGSGQGDFGTSYCFIETTSIVPIGNVPKVYSNFVELDKDPTIIKLTKGKKVYTGNSN